MREPVDATRVRAFAHEVARHFVPELPGWEDRSPFVLSEGGVTVRHFDPYSQALAKLERGFTQDLDDVRAMQDRGWLDVAIARRLYAEAEDWLFRYPAVNVASLRAAIDAAFPD